MTLKKKKIFHRKVRAPRRQRQEVSDSMPDEKAMNEGLAAIYGEQRNDLRSLDKAGSRVTKWLIGVVVGLALIAVVAYAGFFAYMQFFAPVDADPLTIGVDISENVTSGAVVTMVVDYRNGGRVPLAALTLDINVPEAFYVTTTTPQPTNEEEKTWNIGALAAGSDGKIVLQGEWRAAVPTTTSVQVLATYRPANFNADFDAVVSSTVTTLTSNLAVALTAPDKASPGEQVTYAMVVTNNGDTPYTNIAVDFLPTNGFIVSSSTPALESGLPTTWNIAELAPQATQTMSVVGSFTSDIVDVQQAIAKVSIASGDQSLLQSQSNAFTDVIGGGLRLQLVGNGATDAVVLNPGDPLRLSVGYENTGDVNLNNVALLVDFQADGKMPITWNEATLDGGRLTADGIRFDAATVGTLAPRDKQTKNLIFPVRDSLASGESQSWTVVIHAILGEVTMKSQPITVMLNSDTAFTAAARYFDATGAPLGNGPLPPVVGETTTYQLVWTLQNALHALEDVRVSATLPPGVEWDGAIAAKLGTVSYDSSSRVVSWVIADLPAATDSVTAAYDVSVTPDSDDEGAFMKLLSGSAFRGTDTETKSSLQRTADILTTECEGDSGVAGKGIVTE